MLKESIYHAIDPETSGSAHISRVKTYKTTAGPLFLRSCCSPSFVESLKADEGLRAFARLPEREHQLLLSIAQQPESRLTLAYTASGNSRFRYREMIARLFAAHGFAEYLTSEPNIRMDPANIL